MLPTHIWTSAIALTGTAPVQGDTPPHPCRGDFSTGRVAMIRAVLACAVTFILVSNVWAQSIEGRVVGVHDGDSLTILDSKRVQHKIRLYGIDAPEERQEFGDRARQALVRLAMHEKVRVEVHGRGALAYRVK